MLRSHELTRAANKTPTPGGIPGCRTAVRPRQLGPLALVAAALFLFYAYFDFNHAIKHHTGVPEAGVAGGLADGDVQEILKRLDRVEKSFQRAGEVHEMAKVVRLHKIKGSA